MKFTKAKIIAAGVILAGICMITPQQLRAEVPEAQMDGVMGQSIKEEMDDTQISDVDTQRDGLLSTYAMPRLLGASKASSGYTQDFLDSSFTSKVDYTSVTYYHKSDYEDAQLLNGIDVSWWQAKNKKTTALNWEKIHDAGIDFAFVRVRQGTLLMEVFMKIRLRIPIFRRHLKTTSMSVCTYFHRH